MQVKTRLKRLKTRFFLSFLFINTCFPDIIYPGKNDDRLSRKINVLPPNFLYCPFPPHPSHPIVFAQRKQFRIFLDCTFILPWIPAKSSCTTIPLSLLWLSYLNHGQLGYGTLKPISWHFWKGNFGDYINRQALRSDTGRTFSQSRFYNRRINVILFW